MSDPDATLDQVVAHLKILRLAGLADVPRCAMPFVEDAAEETVPAGAVLAAEGTSRVSAPREARLPDAATAKRESAPSPAPQDAPAAGRAEPAEDLPKRVDLAEPWPTPLARDERVAELARLAESVAACSRCGELARTRRQTVFGVGNPMPRLALLGEAPGEEEDKRGESFVGRAGQLLDRMMAACTLRRDEVYILNILKCRPPGNRNPLPAEATACRPFLDRQLEILQPEFVLCLGAVAARNLLGLDLPVGRMRGKLYRYRGAKVVVTYHPSYLLRTESAKRDAWEDLKFLMREMGIDPARRSSDA